MNASHEKSYSDSESLYNKKTSQLPQNITHYNPISYQGIDNFPHSDEEKAYDGLNSSNDHDFGVQGSRNPALRSGRQRKKFAARSKGGEFQAKRRKRRVYFCCVSSEIDVQKLHGYLVGSGDMHHEWKYRLYNEVLHVYKEGKAETLPNRKKVHYNYNYKHDHRLNDEPTLDTKQTRGEQNVHIQENENEYDARLEDSNVALDDTFHISSFGAQEVFVFDFGAVVFWGFPRGEEMNLLKTIRMFVTKGFVGIEEFQSGEDDMAFVISSEATKIRISNDVISLPEFSLPTQRLSVSFAIAQSSVLSIFEARIEKKVEEYKYIPITLAAYGKVHLSGRQLGMMIGEVFVIRHDVNLHTEILGK